jgi:hypothetical protein
MTARFWRHMVFCQQRCKKVIPSSVTMPLNRHYT